MSEFSRQTAELLIYVPYAKIWANSHLTWKSVTLEQVPAYYIVRKNMSFWEKFLCIPSIIRNVCPAKMKAKSLAWSTLFLFVTASHCSAVLWQNLEDSRIWVLFALCQKLSSCHYRNYITVVYTSRVLRIRGSGSYARLGMRPRHSAPKIEVLI